MHREPEEPLPPVIDVLLEGYRTVSFRCSAAEDDDAGTLTFPWPGSLASALSGRARLELRDSVSLTVLAAAEVDFGGGAHRLQLTDDHGRWLSVNKWGRLAPSFDGMSSDRVHELLLEQLDVLTADLASMGIDAFVCYGTLLGLVRDGGLIPHDDDADLAYLSRYDHPADVYRESLVIERALRAAGYDVTRHSGGHLQLEFRRRDGLDHHIDLFTAFRTGDRTYLCFQLGVPHLDLSGRAELQALGRTFAVPVEAEQLLTATYGPSWRVPDPSFTFTTPHGTRARLHAWFGEFNMQRDYWQDFYSSNAVERVPADPSPFARWVLDRTDPSTPLLDVGTGTARDARFFAASGRRLVGGDYSSEAIERARKLSANEGWSADFDVVNLNDLTSVGSFVSRLDWSLGWHLYARFLIHAIDDEARANLWTLAGSVARRGGECWFEFRTQRDADAAHVFGEHYRRYLSLDEVTGELADRGLAVMEHVEGQGLAPYGVEDPWVARLRVGAQA